MTAQDQQAGRDAYVTARGRRAAQDAYVDAAATGKAHTAALDAALDVFAAALAEHTGAHVTGPSAGYPRRHAEQVHVTHIDLTPRSEVGPADEAEEAARWLAEHSDHPRLRGDGWTQVLLHDHNVGLAYEAALKRYGADPAMRSSLLGARDLLDRWHRARS